VECLSPATIFQPTVRWRDASPSTYIPYAAAYHKLAADGLVEIQPGRGTHVLPFDLASFAKTAASMRSHTVGVIIPSWTNPLQVDGSLVVSHDVSEILEPVSHMTGLANGLPYGIVDWPGASGYTVLVDLESAGYLAIRHSLEHGHFQVGLITYMDGSLT
jgi:hypothetical protein